MSFMSSKEEFKDAQQALVSQITALKKQSVLALLLAIVFILATVYLVISLNRKKKEVEQLNASLTVSDGKLRENIKALGALNDSIQHLNKQLDTWRQSLIQDKPPVLIDNQQEFQNSARYNSIVRSRIRSITLNSQQFFGFIVYIQDRKGSMVSDTLRKVLSNKGAIVPDIQHMKPTFKFANSVKYFHPEDRAMAENIRQQLSDILTYKQIGLESAGMRVLYLANKTVPRGQFEIWIDK